MENPHDSWLIEEQCSIHGWDFSHLANRWESDPLPWDYAGIIKQFLRPTDHLLDLGTGGGEFLLTLRHPYELTSVTEGYPPNYELCLQNLAHVGVTVKQVDESNAVDFLDQHFDIVINRHESYDLHEVMRVLKPGGYFITQQCSGSNNIELSRHFIPNFISEYQDFTYPSQVEAFSDAGFDLIEHQEASPRLRFFDVGAIVFYAKNIPWEFPGFSVDRYLSKLDELDQIIQTEGYIESVESRFVIVAQKPK
jgi:SAM-dependent methyltransferase